MKSTNCFFLSIGILLVLFTDGSIRAGFDAFVAADAVGRVFYDSVLVDAKNVHLAKYIFRAGLYALPTGLTYMSFDENMFRLMLRRAIESVSFHRRKGTVCPCIETITIVKKSLAGANSAQGNRRNAEIRCKIMLRDAVHHLRVFLQQHSVSLLRRILDAGKEKMVVVNHTAVGELCNGIADFSMMFQIVLDINLHKDFEFRWLHRFY